jgi:ankyrin repeat protein
VQYRRHTALILAAIIGHTACLRVMVQAGADKDKRYDVRHLHFLVVDDELLD